MRMEAQKPLDARRDVRLCCVLVTTRTLLWPK